MKTLHSLSAGGGGGTLPTLTSRGPAETTAADQSELSADGPGGHRYRTGQ